MRWLLARTIIASQTSGGPSSDMLRRTAAYFGYPHVHGDDAERARPRPRPELAEAAGDPLGGGAAREEAVVGETPNPAAYRDDWPEHVAARRRPVRPDIAVARRA